MTQKLTVARRVALLERDSRSQARSLTEIVKVVAEQGLDLKKLGEWQMTRLLAEAREEERDKALYTRLDQIEGPSGPCKASGPGFSGLRPASSSPARSSALRSCWSTG